MSDYRIVYSDELCHYGIPGMRWGHRKAKPISAERARLQSAKAAYKTANRAYSKAHAQARNYDANPIVRSARSNGFTNELRKKASDRKWDYALKKGKEAYKAEENYKQAKKEYKQTDEYKAKRAKAIKVGAAVVGTALAAYGAYKVSEAIKNKNFEIMNKRGQEAANKYYNERIKNIGVSKFADGSTMVSTDSKRTGFQSSTFKGKTGEKIAESMVEDAKRYNRNIADISDNIQIGYLNKASNATLREATRNIYDEYRKRRR